ncbi:hypothetical protein Micbo1qcDRAFT_171133 [Microdochium bolleyi]|uniref:Uncharacterized protein n=1 Tax=Microdochium bolleyi TaxID=196109 RepID=A0A136JJX3_9PEZI|nr:hypothetical protein Micbo1qcDRAFT_171133 [Microdochium bolleyi]
MTSTWVHQPRPTLIEFLPLMLRSRSGYRFWIRCLFFWAGVQVERSIGRSGNRRASADPEATGTGAVHAATRRLQNGQAKAARRICVATRHRGRRGGSIGNSVRRRCEIARGPATPGNADGCFRAWLMLAGSTSLHRAKSRLQGDCCQIARLPTFSMWQAHRAFPIRVDLRIGKRRHPGLRPCSPGASARRASPQHPSTTVRAGAIPLSTTPACPSLRMSHPAQPLQSRASSQDVLPIQSRLRLALFGPAWCPGRSHNSITRHEPVTAVSLCLDCGTQRRPVASFALCFSARPFCGVHKVVSASVTVASTSGGPNLGGLNKGLQPLDEVGEA